MKKNYFVVRNNDIENLLDGQQIPEEKLDELNDVLKYAASKYSVDQVIVDCSESGNIQLREAGWFGFQTSSRGHTNINANASLLIDDNFVERENTLNRFNGIWIVNDEERGTFDYLDINRPNEFFSDTNYTWRRIKIRRDWNRGVSLTVWWGRYNFLFNTMFLERHLQHEGIINRLPDVIDESYFNSIFDAVISIDESGPILNDTISIDGILTSDSNDSHVQIEDSFTYGIMMLRRNDEAQSGGIFLHSARNDDLRPVIYSGNLNKTPVSDNFDLNIIRRLNGDFTSSSFQASPDEVVNWNASGQTAIVNVNGVSLVTEPINTLGSRSGPFTYDKWSRIGYDPNSELESGFFKLIWQGRPGSNNLVTIDNKPSTIIEIEYPENVPVSSRVTIRTRTEIGYEISWKSEHLRDGQVSTINGTPFYQYESHTLISDRFTSRWEPVGVTVSDYDHFGIQEITFVMPLGPVNITLETKPIDYVWKILPDDNIRGHDWLGEDANGNRVLQLTYFNPEFPVDRAAFAYSAGILNYVTEIGYSTIDAFNRQRITIPRDLIQRNVQFRVDCWARLRGTVFIAGSPWVFHQLTGIIQEVTGSGEVNWQWMRTLTPSELEHIGLLDPNDWERDEHGTWINLTGEITNLFTIPGSFRNAWIETGRNASNPFPSNPDWTVYSVNVQVKIRISRPDRLYHIDSLPLLIRLITLQGQVDILIAENIGEFTQRSIDGNPENGRRITARIINHNIPIIDDTVNTPISISWYRMNGERISGPHPVTIIDGEISGSYFPIKDDITHTLLARFSITDWGDISGSIGSVNPIRLRGSVNQIFGYDPGWLSQISGPDRSIIIELNSNGDLEGTVGHRPGNFSGLDVALRSDSTIRTIRLISDGRMFDIPSGGHFSIANINLQGRRHNSTSLIRVQSGATFIMQSGSRIFNNSQNIEDYSPLSFGGGVEVIGTFHMNGGEISGNAAVHGGGVEIAEHGIFYMNGGEISSNKACFGGGVSNYPNSSFIMRGGEIKFNRAHPFERPLDEASFRGEGGGIEAKPNTLINIINGRLLGNIAQVGGGLNIRGLIRVATITMMHNESAYDGHQFRLLQDASLERGYFSSDNFNILGELREPLSWNSTVNLVNGEPAPWIDQEFSRWDIIIFYTRGATFGFGDNRNGQIGITNIEGNALLTNGHSPPVLIRSATQFSEDQNDDFLLNARSIAVGDGHSMLIKNDGTLWATGNNVDGALGAGNINQVTSFRQIGIEDDWSTISVSSGSSWAIKKDGSLWATGRNDFGQLGLGDTNPRNVFTRVGFRNDWLSVSGNNEHAVAITISGWLFAWGSRVDGRLGLGTLITGNVTIPTRVGFRSDWIQVSAGQRHTVAITRSGELFAWGANANGRTGLGISATTSTNVPTRIGTDSNWLQISTGDAHTMAIRTDGTLWAWGHNINGRLGIGTGTGSGNQTTPIQVGTESNWSLVSAGVNHTMGIRTDGTLWAWGTRSNGRLGFSGAGSQNLPIQVGTDSNWVLVSAGNTHTLAITRSQTESFFRIIFNRQRSGAVRILVSFLTGEITENEIILGGNNTVPVGNQWWVGWNRAPSRINERSFSTVRPGAISLSGFEFSSGTVANTPVGDPLQLEIFKIPICWYATFFPFDVDYSFSFAWGDNAQGRLGIGSTVSQSSPVQVGNDSDWALLSAGNQHTMGIRTDGTLWAWGNGSNGRLGNGSTSSLNNIPTRIGNDSDWSLVSAGSLNTMGIRTDGTLWAWGSRSGGMIGDGGSTSGNQTTPTQVGTDSDWSLVSVGGQHIMGIKTDGTLWAWGFNSQGQFGNGSTSGNQTTPIQVGTDSNWLQVSAGGAHTMGIRTDGTLWGWGSRVNGRLGVGGSTGNQTTPIRVGTDSDWSLVSAGDLHTMGIRSGELFAWGSRVSGRLGIGGSTSGNQTTPVRVGTDSDWSLVSAGDSHTMGIRSGELFAWGNRATGRLGIGGSTSGNETTPVRVGTESNWSLVSAGASHTMGIRKTKNFVNISFNLDSPIFEFTLSNIAITSGTGSVTTGSLIEEDGTWKLATTVIDPGVINVSINHPHIVNKTERLRVFEGTVAPISHVFWDAVANDNVNTTTINFEFSEAVFDLSPFNFRFTPGTGVVIPGFLRGRGSSWSLDVVVIRQGTVNVSIVRSDIDAAPHAVEVFSHIMWSGNAADGTPTPTIRLVFTRPVNLTLSNLTVTDDGGSVIATGLNSVPGGATTSTEWDLDVNVIRAGNIRISVNLDGVSSSPRRIAVVGGTS